MWYCMLEHLLVNVSVFYGRFSVVSKLEGFFVFLMHYRDNVINGDKTSNSCHDFF